MTDHEDLIQRLQRLEPEPVPSATASAHLTAMALAGTAPRRGFRRVATASAAFVGLVLGSTGLAAAGALGPVQGVAHDMLAQASIEVPDSRGESESEAVRATQPTEREREQATAAAARTDCPEGAEREPSTGEREASTDQPADDGRVDDTEPRANDTEPRANDTDPRGTEPGWVDPEATDEELAARLEQRANATCGDGTAIERDGDAAETDRPGTGTTDRPGTGTTEREGDTSTTEREGDTSTTEREGDADDTGREGDASTDAARP